MMHVFITSYRQLHFWFSIYVIYFVYISPRANSVENFGLAAKETILLHLSSLYPEITFFFVKTISVTVFRSTRRITILCWNQCYPQSGVFQHLRVSGIQFA